MSAKLGPFLVTFVVATELVQCVLAFSNFSRDQTSEMASLCLSGHGQLELGEVGKRIESLETRSSGRQASIEEYSDREGWIVLKFHHNPQYLLSSLHFFGTFFWSRFHH